MSAIPNYGQARALKNVKGTNVIKLNPNRSDHHVYVECGTSTVTFTLKAKKHVEGGGLSFYDFSNGGAENVLKAIDGDTFRLPGHSEIEVTPSDATKSYTVVVDSY